MDLRQVCSQDPVKSSAHIERRCIVLLAFDPSPRQRRKIIVGPNSQSCDCRLQLPVACLNLGLVEVVKLQRLCQGKDVLLAVIADQCGFDRVHRGFAADIPERGKNLRIALAGDDGTDDPHAGRTSDVGDDMMKL